MIGRLGMMLLLVFNLGLLCSCGNNGGGNDQSNLVLNGRPVDYYIRWQTADNGVLFEIAPLMEAVGGRFTPVNMNVGMVAQYGKRIGFSSNQADYGMVQVKLCEMKPYSKYENGRFWAPVGFIESVLDGEIVFNENTGMIYVNASAPGQIGDVIPAAADLAGALEGLDYSVLQGDICLGNAIDVCFAGYSPNANGNNAGFPYFVIQPPLPPNAEHAVTPVQVSITLGEDEGLVIIGKTPPACKYYSYRSYFLNRCVSDSNPFDRQKIFTQLGDPINNFNILDDMFYPPTGGSIDNLFNSFFIIVSTADRRLYNDVLDAAAAVGFDRSKVLLDVIDAGLVRLGNDDFADMINFLHRFSMPDDQTVAEAYLNRPTLEILRLTPNVPRGADFLSPFTPRDRGSGLTESHLQPAMDRLRQTIIDTYSGTCDILELDTQTWLDKSGAEAIAALKDVLGETRDTLYLRTDNFTFNQDTIVVAYGVNHALTPKSVYSNVSCYGAERFNGFGGITNDRYEGNISRQFPSIAGEPDMDHFYVWKFARTQIDEDTFPVPQDLDGRYTGINNGEECFIGFRNYIDPDSPDLIGPNPDEIIFDRAMVLTPK